MDRNYTALGEVSKLILVSINKSDVTNLEISNDTKDISAAELVRASIARAESVKALNAIVTEDFERALLAAEKYDRNPKTIPFSAASTL